MKTIATIILVLSACSHCVVASDVAFQIYTNDFQGIPDGWPLTQARELGGTNSPAATNEVVMTRAQYDAHVESLRAAKEAWNREHKTIDRPAREWSAKEFDERVEAIAPGAWDKLQEAADNPILDSNTRRLIRTAIRQSQKAISVISSHPDTIRFMGLAVALGCLTAEQADLILNGP